MCGRYSPGAALFEQCALSCCQTLSMGLYSSFCGSDFFWSQYKIAFWSVWKEAFKKFDQSWVIKESWCSNPLCGLGELPLGLSVLLSFLTPRAQAGVTGSRMGAAGDSSDCYKGLLRWYMYLIVKKQHRLLKSNVSFAFNWTVIDSGDTVVFSWEKQVNDW